MAAILTPWFHSGGKLLAATAETRDLPAIIESVAGSCGRADLSRYFDRALLFSALILLPALRWRIRRLRVLSHTGPDRRKAYPWPAALAQCCLAFVIAGALLWALGSTLASLGAYDAKPAPPLGKFVSKAAIPAIAASFLEEWFFRGILLGLWLRLAKPASACVGSSLVFATVHFLKPADDSIIAHPDHPLSGFQLVGQIMHHFTDPLFFGTEFVVLFAIGLILAWARVRTGALWFSIGLHAGWIAAFKSFNLLHLAVEAHALRPWGIGGGLNSGLLPLLTLAITAVVCHFAMLRWPAGGINRASPSPPPPV